MQCIATTTTTSTSATTTSCVNCSALFIYSFFDILCHSKYNGKENYLHPKPLKECCSLAVSVFLSVCTYMGFWNLHLYRSLRR